MAGWTLDDVKKKLDEVNPKQGEAAENPVNGETSTPKPGGGMPPLAAPLIPPLASLERWQLFLLACVCGQALAALGTFLPYSAGISVFTMVLRLAAYVCGAFAFLKTDDKALSAIKMPCAITSGFCAFAELFYLIRFFSR